MAFALLATLFAALSATEGPVASGWSPVEGLPTTVITAVLQDAEGYVWVGTHVGLARTDGHRVMLHRPSSTEPGTLSNATVNVGALLEAGDGTLWIGTKGGLCRRRRAQAQFECVGAAGAPALASGNVLALAEAPDGTIWVGTAAGLHVVEPTTFEIDTPNATGVPHPYVSALAVSDDGTVWVGTARGLAVRAPGQVAFEPVGGVGPVLVQSIHAATTGGAWVGTLGRGLFRASSPGQPAQSIALGSGFEQGRSQSGPSFVMTLREDAAGRLWAGTWGGGLFRLDPRLGSAVQVGSASGSDFPSDQVVALDLDGDGGVWAATWNGLVHRPSSPPYRLLPSQQSVPSSLSHPQVTSLLADPSGDLWVGTFGGGLNRCDPRTLRCDHYRYDADDSTSLCHDVVLDLAFGPDGALWVATSGAGACRRDPATGAFSPAPAGAPSVLHQAHIYAISFDRDGRLWLGTAEGGLFGFRDIEEADSVLHLLDPASVYVLAHAPTGETWAGTLGQGVCQVREGDADCFGAESEGLSDDWVTATATAPGGLWVGGLRGLDWVPSGGTPRAVLGERDLLRPHVTCVLSDMSGTWVATAGGIVHVGLNDKRVTGASGLPTRGFLRPACTRVGDQLAFGTEEGLVLFDPRDVLGVPRARTRITTISVDGDPAFPEDGVLTLESDQSGPSFDFATLTYTAPADRRYVYRLDGFDANWSPPTARADVTYPKLPAGRYTFRVRPALQPDAADATVQLRVLAPVWKRPWFLGLAGMLTILLVAVAHRARVARLLQLEQTRRSIADDLHDDVGGRLSGLALALDVAARTLTGTARTEVSARADEARSLLSDLRDTVWVIDGSASSLANLVERVRLTAETLLPDARIHVTATGDLEYVLNMQRRRHLLFFCTEALHNASRHGSPETVQIAFDVGKGGSLDVCIEDDGVGFEPVLGALADSSGRGLGALRRRGDALGGTVDVQSAPGAGTRVVLTVGLLSSKRAGGS